MPKTTLPPVEFTANFIRDVSLPPGAIQVVVRDRTLKGFLLVVGKQKKTFAVQRHMRDALGRKVTIRKIIGDAADMSLRKARAEAQTMLGDISKRKDPRRDAPKGGLTLGEAWAQHAQEMRDGGNSERNVKEFEALLTRHFADWKDVSLAALGSNPEEMKRRQKAIQKNGGSIQAASKPLRMFRAVYTSHPLLPPDPTAHLKLPEYGERADHLPDAQMKVWWSKVLTVKDDYRRAFHIMSMLCGNRPGALMAARVEHLNLDDRYLYFPKMKNRSPFWMPLSDPLVEFLRGASDGDWLFPAHSRSGHIEETDQPELIMKGARGEMHSWTGNWLRHNYATHAANAGLTEREVGSLIAHKSGLVTGRYIDNKGLLQSMVNLQNRVTAHLLGRMGVVSLPPCFSK